MVYGTLMQLHFPMLSGPSQMEAVFTNALPWMLAKNRNTPVAFFLACQSCRQSDACSGRRVFQNK